MLAGLGGKVDRILIVGCEPATVEEGIGLSDVVAASVDRAIAAVDDVLAELCPSASPNGASP
jgi:hydrogenase maturation protease